MLLLGVISTETFGEKIKELRRKDDYEKGLNHLQKYYEYYVEGIRELMEKTVQNARHHRINWFIIKRLMFGYCTKTRRICQIRPLNLFFALIIQDILINDKCEEEFSCLNTKCEFNKTTHETLKMKLKTFQELTTIAERISVELNP